MKKIGLGCCIILFVVSPLWAQNRWGYSVVKDYPEILVNPYSRPFSPDSVLTSASRDEIHPHLFESVPAEQKDSLRAVVISRMRKDTLNLTEALYSFKPYLDRLRWEDPHFRPLIPWFITKDKTKSSDQVALLPWDVVCIQDTVVIACSYDPKFRKGDRVVEINRIPVEEFLKHAYVDRYFPFFVCQAFYHYSYSPEYTVRIERGDQLIDIVTSGITYPQYLQAQEGQKEGRKWTDAGTGYFAIDDFVHNKKLIKELTAFTKRLKKEGITNLILDLRKNGGGSGEGLDELLALFIDSDSIPYLRGVELRVSAMTGKEYDFLTEDQMGQLVDLPENAFVRVIPLNRQKYAGLKTYVLISGNTGSTAASFANILQYNKGGKLVGEPLLHNALRYGEVVTLSWNFNRFCALTMSTVRHNEYTRRPDGQVYPDIPIPYVASEYMKGGDPVLEKLLAYLQNEPK